MRSMSTSLIDSDTESVCSVVSTIADLSSDMPVDLAPTAKMEEGEIEDKESPEWEIDAVGIERQIPKRKRKAVSIVHVARVCNNGKYGQICCMQHVAHVHTHATFAT